jgi:uncharacterized protein
MLEPARREDLAWSVGMSLEYPDWLDARRAAEGRREFSGTMSLARMTRLVPLLASSDGFAWFSAGFGFDEQGKVAIRIEVEAELMLICQRSLEPYSELVKRSSVLGVIEDIAEEDSLPEHLDPVLAENGRLALLELVEEELLLGMPQVPRKPEQAAESSVTGADLVTSEHQAEPKQQPFAGLAEQLKKHARDSKKDR